MTGLSSVESALLDGMDDQAPVMLALVEAWAAINSGSGNPDGLATMAAILAEAFGNLPGPMKRSEEHTSELQSLMRISYAVFCLKKKKQHTKLQSTMQ